MESLIVAFEGEKTALRIRDIIESGGVAECLICHSGAEVKRIVYQQGVTVVVSGYKLRDETAENLYTDLPSYCSMLVLAPQSYLELMGKSDIFRLTAPASREDLLASVQMLLQMGHRMARYIRPRRSQEERDLVEQAKAVLMDRHGMSEEEAHRFLQKTSMDSGVKLNQTAQLVLDGMWNQ